MVKKYLIRKPHDVTDEFWWYEENYGLILIVCPIKPDGTRDVTKVFKIPWRSVKAALKRKERR